MPLCSKCTYYNFPAPFARHCDSFRSFIVVTQIITSYLVSENPAQDRLLRTQIMDAAMH
jgi:hypothetical protein